jgi:hypothetical protein
MHGLFSHGGTDELGLRFFACYSSAYVKILRGLTL